MKTSRSELKAIVKECLIEILNEGIGQMQGSRTARPAAVTEQRTRSNRPAFDPRLDTPTNKRGPTEALRNAIKEGSGGNPVLADMLADTAMTTLPAQLGGGDRMGTPLEGTSVRPGGQHAVMQQEQFNGNPDEVFGDSSARWADLAFMDVAKKTA